MHNKQNNHIPLLLTEADPTGHLARLIKYRNVAINYVTQKRKTPPLKIRRAIKQLYNILNNDGYRIASNTGDNPPTLYIFRPLRVSHAVKCTDEGYVSLDIGMTVKELKKLAEVVNKIHESTDPFDE